MFLMKITFVIIQQQNSTKIEWIQLEDLQKREQVEHMRINRILFDDILVSFFCFFISSQKHRTKNGLNKFLCATIKKILKNDYILDIIIDLNFRLFMVI